MEKLLTIFTPTYNRAYILHLCYESLKRQTCKDFIWLIIDDGSTDNTKELVNNWIEEKVITIYYHYQKNQGMHGAHNTAYELTDTELCVCIDSDDFMTDNAVEYITKYWREFGSDRYAGMVGMNAFTNGDIVGKPLPITLKECKYSTIYHDYRHDKKYIYRKDVFRNYPPYPVFEGERLTPLNCNYFLIDEKYWLLVIPEVLCIIEYLEDGSTRNIFKQYKISPKGFAYARKIQMKAEPRNIHRFKAAIHYVSSSIMIKDKQFIKNSPKKVLTIAAIIPGVLLYSYLINTKKEGFVKTKTF